MENGKILNPSRAISCGYARRIGRRNEFWGWCTVSHRGIVRSPTCLVLRGARVTREEGTRRAKHMSQVSPPIPSQSQPMYDAEKNYKNQGSLLLRDGSWRKTRTSRHRRQACAVTNSNRHKLFPNTTGPQSQDLTGGLCGSRLVPMFLFVAAGFVTFPGTEGFCKLEGHSALRVCQPLIPQCTG